MAPTAQPTGPTPSAPPHAAYTPAPAAHTSGDKQPHRRFAAEDVSQRRRRQPMSGGHLSLLPHSYHTYSVRYLSQVGTHPWRASQSMGTSLESRIRPSSSSSSLGPGGTTSIVPHGNSSPRDSTTSFPRPDHQPHRAPRRPHIPAQHPRLVLAPRPMAALPLALVQPHVQSSPGRPAHRRKT